MSSTYWWLVEWTKTSVFSFHILYCNNSDMFSSMQNLHRNKSVFLPLPQQSHSKTPGYCWAFVFLLLEASAAQVYNMRSVSIIPIVYCIANSKVAWMCFHPAGKQSQKWPGFFWPRIVSSRLTFPSKFTFYICSKSICSNWFSYILPTLWY